VEVPDSANGASSYTARPGRSTGVSSRGDGVESPHARQIRKNSGQLFGSFRVYYRGAAVGRHVPPVAHTAGSTLRNAVPDWGVLVSGWCKPKACKAGSVPWSVARSTADSRESHGAVFVPRGGARDLARPDPTGR